jgi:hypothetical protein
MGTNEKHAEARLTEARMRADRVCNEFGQEAPRPWSGELVINLPQAGRPAVLQH